MANSAGVVLAPLYIEDQKIHRQTIARWMHKHSHEFQHVIEGVLNPLDFEWAGGADPTGVRDSSAAFTALWAAVLASYRGLAPNAGVVSVEIYIPAGEYLITTSINWTQLSCWNIHVRAGGAVFIGKCAGKPVFDCTEVRGLQWWGGLIHGDSSAQPSCAILVGQEAKNPCGNNNFNALKTTGNFTIAGFGNIGSETTRYSHCYFQNATQGACYGYAGDGLHRLGFTSDYTTLRTPGAAVSFTSNTFESCRFANYATSGTGAAFFGEFMIGWEMDKGCYFLAFTNSDIQIYNDPAWRTYGCQFRGLFETAQSPGLQYAVEFLVPSGTTELADVSFDIGRAHMNTGVFKMTNPAGGTPGNLSIINSNIHFGVFTGSTSLPAFVNCGTMTLGGEIHTKLASNLNMGDLASFTGEIYADAGTSLASKPVAGAYTFFAKVDGRKYTQPSDAWTPTITFDTPGDLSVTYASSIGRSFVEGALVNIVINMTFTPVYTTSAGGFRINTLPIRSHPSAGIAQAIGVTYINSAWAWPTSATQVTAFISANSTSVQLRGHGNGIASTEFTTVHVSSGKAFAIMLSGAYVNS